MSGLPYKQTCKQCNINFRSKGPNKYFCNRTCKIEWNEKNIYKYKKCLGCDKKVRVYKNTKKQKFCTRKCYGQYARNNPEIYNLEERAKVARTGWSEDSWKKSIKTRTENGNIITNHTWKQYWKRCDYLTQKIRKQMLESWDGFDYIDGKYIKENLNLHYSHGDYPTLDHVIPRSICFKEGISPDEATSPTNLKWTTRSNNSKKHQTQNVVFN